MNQKRGQVTLFVILGVVIVMVVIILGFFAGNFGGKDNNNPTISGERTPAQEFIQLCVQEKVVNGLNSILPNGGVLNVSSPSIFYELRDVKYLCHTPNEHELCTNLEPMLISKVENELYNFIEDEVETCFNSLLTSYSAYELRTSPTELEVKIDYDRLNINIQKEIELSSDSETIYYDDFSFVVSDRTYTILRIAQKIINEEVTCNCGSESCNANLYEIMRQNYGFSVEKDLTSDGSEVFKVGEDRSGREFVFAIKNCVNLG